MPRRGRTGPALCSRPAGRGRAPRRGFTLLELVLVLVIIGVTTGFAIPRLRSVSDRMTLSGAKSDLASAVAMTRAAAIQKGREGRLVVRSNRVIVVVDTARVGGTALSMTLLDHNLKSRRAVLVVPRAVSDTMLPFNSRGYARTRSGGTAVYALEGPGGLRDSVCVSSFGVVSKQGCIQ